MIKSVRFHPNAEIELYEASAYYELRQRGLGTAFISEVERAIKQIKRKPESSPKILKEVRKKILWRFPYNLFYSFENNSIRILAVANQKRRPFYWVSRK